jgi:hypothetical protein
MKDRTKRYTDADVLKELERRIEARGLRAFAREHGMSPTFVSMVRHGQAAVSSRMANALGFVDDGKRWVLK